MKQNQTLFQSEKEKKTLKFIYRTDKAERGKYVLVKLSLMCDRV